MEVTKNNQLMETRSVATVYMCGSQWGQKKLEWCFTTQIFVQNARCVQWLHLSHWAQLTVFSMGDFDNIRGECFLRTSTCLSFLQFLIFVRSFTGDIGYMNDIEAAGRWFRPVRMFGKFERFLWHLGPCQCRLELLRLTVLYIVVHFVDVVVVSYSSSPGIGLGFSLWWYFPGQCSVSDVTFLRMYASASVLPVFSNLTLCTGFSTRKLSHGPVAA